MQFDLLDRPLLYIPVTWPGLAADDGGGAKRVEHEVDIQIEILDREEFRDWMVQGAGATDEVADQPAAERATAELAVFKRVAKGWRNIKANGRAVTFTDENIARLLLWPGFVGAFGAAYVEAWQGQVATREGNFEGSAEHGQAAEPNDATRKDETPPAN